MGAALDARRTRPQRLAAAHQPLPRRLCAGNWPIAFFIFEKTSGKLAGGITLGNIRHGVSQSGHVGYWIGERYGGRGTDDRRGQGGARFAFDTLRLHRIEAACIPDNVRSIRVLEKAGFRREGLLRSYLRINGIWQDHYLYARIADDPPGAGTKD